MSNIRAVYFTGASGTGKTTLAEYVEKNYGLARIPSASREVSAKLGITNDKGEFTVGTRQYAEFQMMVCRRQLELEKEQVVTYVSDRAFDHLAYSAVYGTNCRQIAALPEMKEYLERLTDGRSLVFHVRPTRDVQHHAKMQHQREQFLDWEDMHKVDGIIRYIAEVNGITTVPISCTSLLERRWLVDGHLKTHGILPTVKEYTVKPEDAPSLVGPCDLPPHGWYCTRGKGHEGPCAAHPDNKGASG